MKHKPILNFCVLYGLNLRVFFLLLLTLSTTFLNRISAQKLDTSFKPDLYAVTANGEISASILQPDGKLLVAGSFSSINDVERRNVARINPDGSVDESFEAGAETNVWLRAVALQPDGKILIGGNQGKLVRLNADGSLDPSFSANLPNHVTSITLQDNGMVLVGMQLAVFNKPTDIIIRLKPDGTVDEGFLTGIKVIYPNSFNGIYSTRIQPDGKIIVAGVELEVKDVNGVVTRRGIFRLNDDGSLDENFKPESDIRNARGMLLQPDGKMIVAGNVFARLNPDGSRDQNFNPEEGTDFNISALALQPDGKLLIGKSSRNGVIEQTDVSFITSKYTLKRLNIDGTADENFNQQLETSSDIQTITLQPNSGIFIGGRFVKVNGSKEQGLALLKADGTLDNNFDAGEGIVARLRVSATAVQPDGKIIIGGMFEFADGISRTNIARLNPDGSIDDSFNSSVAVTGFSEIWPIQAIKLLPNDKILIGGNFEYYNGISVKSLARLNPDGSLDTEFNPEFSPEHERFNTFAIDVQPDGKIIVGGFYQYNYKFIYRFNPDGSLDETFKSDTGINNTVNSVAVQPDGKILIGGQFSAIGGVTRARLARLNADGSLDEGFIPELKTGSPDIAFAVRPDGKIIVGGALFTADLSKRGPLALLNSDGKFEKIIDQAVGAVYGITLLQNGNILVNGNFNFTGGTDYYGLTRLIENLSLDEAFDTYGRSIKPNRSFAFQPDGKLVLGGLAGMQHVNRFNIMQRVELPVNQAIAFTDITNKTEGDAPIQLTATASSGLPVSFEVMSGQATIAGNILTITGAGELKVKAYQAGSALWEPAAAVEQVFCVNPEKPVITQNENTLTSSSAQGNQWYRNGELLDGATGQELVIAQEGAYSVSVSAGGCTSQQSEAVQTTLTSIADISTSGIAVYPNPATDTLIISKLKDGQVEVILYDVAGRIALKKKIKTDRNSVVTLEVATLARGIYTLEVVTPKESLKRKVILK